MYKVLLFYKYISIDCPKKIILEQNLLCLRLSLKGRIIVAQEGINGTLCGTEENCNLYKVEMKKNFYFSSIEFKESISSFFCFDKLQIKEKNEIVGLGIKPKLIPASKAAIYITAKELHLLLTNNFDSVVLIDTRNDYESAIGRFKNAITPPLKTFREFPAYFKKNLELFRGKDIIMYCTGGVRCERASALLSLLKIAKSVRHLEGGIHKYVEEYPDGFFRGSNYVFDERIRLKINEDILSSCIHCKKPSDLYNNCLYSLCNKHYIVCDECFTQNNQSCSPECIEKIKVGGPKRPILKSRIKEKI